MISILRKTDIALIILLILFAAASYFMFGSSGYTGSTVAISVGGAIYKELPLSEDTEIEIFLPDGTHSNTLIIKDGEALMIYADCPDGLCLRHQPIRLSGEMIVCLPNRIVAEISGGASAYNEYDAIAG